jgi:hypothetical protein
MNERMARCLGETKEFIRSLLHPKSLLVLSALFDLVATVVRVDRRYDMTDVPLPWPTLNSPIHYYVEPGLLLLAALGLRLSRPWAYLVAILAGLGIFYRGYEKWRALLAAVDIVWSRSTRSMLEYWWTYSDGAWDWVRLVLAALIATYAALSLASLLHSRRQRKIASFESHG